MDDIITDDHKPDRHPDRNGLSVTGITTIIPVQLGICDPIFSEAHITCQSKTVDEEVGGDDHQKGFNRNI